MTTIVTSDLQLADNERDAYRFKFFGTLRSIIQKHRASDVYILGDLTEAKDNHSAALVNRIVDEFQDLSRIARILILRGNHDGMTPDNPFFRFLKHVNNIQWINTPTEWSNDLFLPHTLDHAKDWKDIDFSGYELIFAHNTFEGAMAGNYQMRGIPQSIFPKDACVISGDVHGPQKSGVVTYVGAPYLVDFGDDYEPRVLMLEDNGIRSIKVPGPQKRLIECKWPTNPSDFKPPFSRPFTDAAFAKCGAGDVVKVRVTLSMKQREHWSKIRDAIHSWSGEKKLNVYSIHPIVEYAADKRTKLKAHTGKDDDRIIRDYAQRSGTDKATLATGLEMIKC